VNKGLAGASVEAKRTLYPYLIELYTKMGDTQKASAALGELKALAPAQNTSAIPGIGTPEPDNSANAAMAKAAEADIALTNATNSLASHDYAKVISNINDHSASFVDPDRQAKALYLLAEAKAATATTPEAWEEAALAYMRVVAHFKSQPNGPAADALYKTGTIEEKLNKPGEAKLIYNQVINEYKNSKAAEDAKAAVARLNK
jgi:TolA-binding protein